MRSSGDPETTTTPRNPAIAVALRKRDFMMCPLLVLVSAPISAACQPRADQFYQTQARPSNWDASTMRSCLA